MSVFLPTALPTTSLYAGIIGLGFAAFSLQVGLTRVSKLSLAVNLAFAHSTGLS